MDFILKRSVLFSLFFAAAGCAFLGGQKAVPGAKQQAPERDIWPPTFPSAGRNSLRGTLTADLRTRLTTLGLDGIAAGKGRAVSRALVLFPRDRARAGVMTFEIETGPDKGVHQCEALGRGSTSYEPKTGWIPGVIREADGRETAIYYAPAQEPDGATQPGLYELRNMRPDRYKIKFLNPDISGEGELAARLIRPDADAKPYFTGVWKHWYPRDPEYAALAPVDMVWSSDQENSQGAGVPVFELPDVKKDPDQVSRDPHYYTGPNGRYGTAVHTDRWDDGATARDPKLSARNEFRSFLFRDTAGCVKVRPDCLLLINQFIDEQTAKGRQVQLEVREIEPSAI